MTQIRKHIVDDMAQHISSKLITDFRRSSAQMEAAGISCEEGALICAKVGKQVLIATVGGAALLTGAGDLDEAFQGLVAAVMMEIVMGREVIARELRQCAGRPA